MKITQTVLDYMEVRRNLQALHRDQLANLNNELLAALGVPPGKELPLAFYTNAGHVWLIGVTAFGDPMWRLPNKDGSCGRHIVGQHITNVQVSKNQGPAASNKALKA